MGTLQGRSSDFSCRHMAAYLFWPWRQTLTSVIDSANVTWNTLKSFVSVLFLYLCHGSPLYKPASSVTRCFQVFFGQVTQMHTFPTTIQRAPFISTLWNNIRSMPRRKRCMEKLGGMSSSSGSGKNAPCPLPDCWHSDRTRGNKSLFSDRSGTFFRYR